MDFRSAALGQGSLAGGVIGDGQIRRGKATEPEHRRQGEKDTNFHGFLLVVINKLIPFPSAIQGPVR